MGASSAGAVSTCRKNETAGAQMAQAALAIPSVQQDLETLAHVIRTADQGAAHAVANMVEHALTAGDALIQAKAKVGHGNWLKYLRDECEIGADSAERYMKLARGREVLEANSARMRNLSITQALKLIDGNKQKSQPRPAAPKPTKAVKAAERLTSLAWSTASPADRTRFLEGVGLDAFLAAVPPDWDLRARILREASVGEYAEARRKTPTQIQKERNSEVTILGRGHRHAGPTLEAEAIALEEMKH
jgi:hypothetical protein